MARRDQPRAQLSSIPDRRLRCPLLKLASVIFTHVNEVATQGGKLKPDSQTAALMKQVETPAYLAISERTMEFDGKGKCVSGC
jgi:hypothetical protein